MKRCPICDKLLTEAQVKRGNRCCSRPCARQKDWEDRMRVRLLPPLIEPPTTKVEFHCPGCNCFKPQPVTRVTQLLSPAQINRALRK